jgi:hypothetical protein
VEIIHRHPCLSAAVLACGPWWHFGTGECGCPMELELGVGATVSGSDAPFFCSIERKSGALQDGNCFFRPLAGLRPKRLSEPPEKPCQTDPKSQDNIYSSRR